MSAPLRAALFVLPFALLFLGIRWIGRDDGERWRDRVAPHCPGAIVGVDERDLLVIAGSAAEARAAAAEVRDFRRALVAGYRDLLGAPRFDRMVVVVFPDAGSVQAYAGESARMDRGAAGKLHGYTDPLHGAVFVPADAIGTLRHETVHWVMETARGPTAPAHSLWLSEGLAQLFETFDPLDPRPPRPDGVVAYAVDVDRLIHIESHAEFMGPDVGRNYAEALLLCAFLFEKRAEGLRDYVEAERKNADRRPLVFQRIFSHREEPFRRDLAAFLAALR